MADIVTGTRAKLLATAGVAALLSTRVYPDQLEQGCAMPAAVIYLISGTDETCLAGLVGVAHARIQIDSYATTRIAANALATAIRNALAATGGRGTWGTVYVSGCTPQGGERHSTQARGDGGNEPYCIASRDYLVSFNG